MLPETHPIRVLMLTPDYPPKIVGGCALSCQLLVEGLRSRGIEVDVNVFNGDEGVVESKMGKTRFFPSSKTLLGLNMLALTSMMDSKTQYDIIHVYNTQQLPAAVHFGHNKGIKVVGTMNNMTPICLNTANFDEVECADCDGLDSLKCALQRKGPVPMRMFMPMHWLQYASLHRLTREADAFIALSEATRQCYLNAGFDEKRFHLIPNMFDPNVVEMARHSVRTEHEGMQIMYLGRLQIEKGLQVLIKAVPLMNTKEFKVHLVGKGDYEKELRQLVEEMGVGDRVQFDGFVGREEISRFYSLADLFVHPAIWPEPFPRTLLESLAFGVPLVVSSSGSCGEILGDAGVVFQNGDEKDLASKLDRLLGDEKARQRMIESGKSVLSHYSPDSVLSGMIEVYRGLMSGTSGTSAE